MPRSSSRTHPATELAELGELLGGEPGLAAGVDVGLVDPLAKDS
jgi:hypothetical protein